MSADKVSDWIEWHRRCDLDRCPPDVRERLAHYGLRTFEKQTRLQLFGEKDNPQPLPVDLPGGKSEQEDARQVCWKYIENYLLTHRAGASRKSCKAYVCDYAFSQPEKLRHASLRSGFIAMTRNVVRRYYADEIRDTRLKAARELVSFDEPISEEDGAVRGDRISRDDLAVRLPLDGLTQDELSEFKDIAARFAPAIWDGMSEIERDVIWAALQDIPLTSAWLRQKCGLEKSQLYQARKDFDARITEMLKKMNMAGDDEAVRVLKMFIAVELEERIFRWKKPEKASVDALGVTNGDAP